MVNFYAQHRRKVFRVVSGGYESETTTLLDALGGSYSTGRQDAINALIAGLKTDGIWTKPDQFWWCLADIADTCVNWKSPGTFNLTNSGATLTAHTSLSFDGINDSLSTNFNPSTAGGNYSLNSATIGAWKTSDQLIMSAKTAAAAGIEFTNLSGSSNRRLINASSASNVSITVNNDTLWLLTRTSSAGGTLYYNATTSSLTQTSSSVPNVTIVYGAENLNGTLSGYRAGVYQGGLIGGALTGTDVANLRSRLATFRTNY